MHERKGRLRSEHGRPGAAGSGRKMVLHGGKDLARLGSEMIPGNPILGWKKILQCSTTRQRKMFRSRINRERCLDKSHPATKILWIKRMHLASLQSSTAVIYARVARDMAIAVACSLNHSKSLRSQSFSRMQMMTRCIGEKQTAHSSLQAFVRERFGSYLTSMKKSPTLLLRRRLK